MPSAFPNCDFLAHLASVTSVTCDGGSVLGQFALECTNSTESPLGSPLAPSLRLGGGSASVTIGSPAGIPLFSEAGDVLVAWEWNGRGGAVAMVVAVVVVVMVVVMGDRVVGGASDVHCASSCAAPVLFGSRWVGSTGSATSSSGGDFVQLVGTRMYRECMGGKPAECAAKQRLTRRWGMMAWRVRAAIIEDRMWALGGSRSPKRARHANWERAQCRQSEHFCGRGRGASSAGRSDYYQF